MRASKRFKKLLKLYSKQEISLYKIRAEEFIEDMFEFDITVRIPPKKEWAAQVKVKSLGKAIPHIVEPEEF